MVAADMRFAIFIDETAAAYAKSAVFRAALHAEAGGEAPSAVCPPHHRHGETPTCYSTHKCRCDGCRAAGSKYQKQKRIRRAHAMWAAKNERETA
jgi:hypothetical protein